MDSDYVFCTEFLAAKVSLKLWFVRSFIHSLSEHLLGAKRRQLQTLHTLYSLVGKTVIQRMTNKAEITVMSGALKAGGQGWHIDARCMYQGEEGLTHGMSLGMWPQGCDDPMASKSVCLSAPCSVAENLGWQSRNSLDVRIRWTKVSSVSAN